MTRLELELLASRWVLMIERHRSELDDLQREITETVERFQPSVVLAFSRAELARQRRTFWARPVRPDPPEAA